MTNRIMASIITLLPLFVLNPTPAQATSFSLNISLLVSSEDESFEGTYLDDELCEDPTGCRYEPTSEDLRQALAYCKDGDHGYDIESTSRIKIENQSGKIIGLGRITKVFVEPQYEYENGKEIGGFTFSCRYTGSVRIPRAKFYKIFVDRRQGPEYSFQELSKAKWKIKLSL